MALISKVPIGSAYADGGNTRVLVYAEAWGRGGIESFLMNLFRRLQGKGFAFALFTTWDWNDELDPELGELGIGRWTSFPGERPGQLTRLREGSKAYGNLIDEIGCDVSYVNTMNGMGFLWAQVAEKHDVSLRVVHSHNSAFGTSAAGLKSVAHRYGMKAYGGSATVCVACSEAAGHYLFGNRSFKVVNNGIDTGRFAFEMSSRTRVRTKFGVPVDALLFGSIGRIEEAKNPLFQIRTFAEIQKEEPSARYLMVGEGDMRGQVEALVEQLGLRDSVIMPGYLADPAPVYSALDCFLMPSLYEGVPLACIECQCSGCPILTTDNMAKEAQVTDAEYPLSLGAGEARWAEEAVRVATIPVERTDYARQVAASGFSADETARSMSALLSSREVDRL